ncbi:uncharacterized protein [Clytia hemisphaerica]|uniref:uncharacterized protein isoform X2 n=1 Tax=Clytia hemisphaerica TaxID=252671 RepID=UPI0034D7935A
MNNENYNDVIKRVRGGYPTQDSNDQFELFVCVYNPDHKVNSKTWSKHIRNCSKLHSFPTKICQYNALHHVPYPEYEWHMMTCLDKHNLAQDFAAARPMATTVNHNPDWVKPDCDEDWDEEAEESPQASFSIDARKAMPIHLYTKEDQAPTEDDDDGGYYGDDGFYYDAEGGHVAADGIYYDKDGGYWDEDGYYYDKYGGYTAEDGSYVPGEGYTEGPNGEQAPVVAAPVPASPQRQSVLNQELLLERPANWEQMSSTAKKNYKKKYNKQRQRMQEEGVTEEDFKPSKDPHDWTEERREAKLAAIKAKFPLAPDKQNSAKFDYSSLLNIVCQKCRIHLPEFRECPGLSGGFGYQCRVGQVWYQGMDFCTTKKDAKHECSKWALLGMEVPGIDNEQQVSQSGRSKPVHPRLAADLQKQREADEVGRLMASNMYDMQKKNVTPLRQPNIQQSPKVVSPAPAPAPPQQQPQQHQQPPQQNQQQPSQQTRGWGQKPSNSTPQPGFGQAQAATPATNQTQNRQPQGWGQQPQSTPAGWGQQQQQQPTQQKPQQQQQATGGWSQQQRQQPTQQKPQQQQQAAGGWGQQQRQQPTQQKPQQQQQAAGGWGQQSGSLVNGMQKMTMQDDFPALGGGAPKNEWSTVSKKSNGVGNAGKGKGRGRGRGTTMKL